MSCDDNHFFQPERPPIKPEIDCFKLEKVFEECSKTFIAKVKIPLEHPHHAHKIKCVNAHIHPREIACQIDEEIRKIRIMEDHIMVNLQANLIDEEHVHPLHAMGLLQIPEENTEFILKRAGEPGLECQVEIFAECLECNITKKTHDDMVSEITCCIGILLIAKLTAKVQVRIPIFGYCPVPVKCIETPHCPKKYDPQKIPYPKQKKEVSEKQQPKSLPCEQRESCESCEKF